MILSIAAAATIGCGRSAENGGVQGPQPSQSGNQAAQGFSDIPEYSGASRDQSEEINFGIEPIISPTSYGQTEWRYYTSTDDKAKLSEFYQREMVAPKYGWKQAAWGNIGDNVSWGIYTKGNGDPVAWVVLNSTGQGTKFALVRGTGKLPQ